MEKRYYWLKFKDDFFDSKRIKKLRKLAGGDTYIIIYLKMQLKALRTDGVLEFTGVEENFADELALDIDENPEDVRMVLGYLMTYGLCECSDNIHYLLPYVVENTGSETAGTQRWRDWKNRKSLESNTMPTLPQQTANVEKENREREKSKSKSRVHKFTPPTLEQVKAYAKEANLNVDCDKFYTYFTTPDDSGRTWIDSKGNPVKNWKQKLITWAGREKPSRPKSQTFDNYKAEGVSHSNLDAIAADMDTDFGGSSGLRRESKKRNTLLNYDDSPKEVVPIHLDYDEP